MRWFRNLTGSTYDREPIAEALGGAASAGGAGAEAGEAGWLARGYRVTAGFLKRHYKVALGAAAGVGALVAAERGAGAGTMVDLDWRLAGDYSNINYLADKTTLDPAVTNVGIWEAPYGSVFFEDGNFVPADWKLFFYDDGGQPAGVYRIVSEGEYGTNVYGDNPGTGLDEGIPMNAAIKVLAQSPQNKFFSAFFLKNDVPADLIMYGGEGGAGQYDVRVTNNEITPEPATLALMGIGAGVAALTRGRRKFQPEMDSDLGRPVKS